MAEVGFKPRFVSPKTKVGEEGGNIRHSPDLQHPRSQGDRREWLTTSVSGGKEAEEELKSAAGFWEKEDRTDAGRAV